MNTISQLNLLKKQYIMKKMLASYFDEKARQELADLRKIINSMEK